MDEELHDVAKQIFVNSTVAAKIVNVATSTKPLGWSHKSNAPYYKKIYAEEIKTYVDMMIVNGQDIIYRYSVFCSDESGMSPQTLYNRVNQSIRYLIECMDTPDHKYARWYESVHVTRKRDVGVVISAITSIGAGAMKPESVEPKASKPVWQRHMDDWIEEEDNYDPFVKEGLALSPSDIVDLKVRIAGLKNIQASITESFVRLIRIG